MDRSNKTLNSNTIPVATAKNPATGNYSLKKK